MQQLSGQDSLFLYLETPKTPLHIGGVYIFDSDTKQFDLAEIKQFFEVRLHQSRIFRQRLVEVPMDMGHPFWVEDPNFHIDNHIKHLVLPLPGNMASLAEVASEIYSPALDRSRPLWEITFITGINDPLYSPNAFAMLIKVHHAAIDGGSGVEIMAALLSMTEEPFVPAPPDQPWQPEAIPSPTELIAKSYSGIVDTSKRFFDFIKSTRNNAVDLKKELSANLISPPPLPTAAPKTIFNTSVSGKKNLGGIDIPLSSVKKMRKLVEGTTINDVLLCACAGALRRYLIHTGRLPMKNLVAMAPISVRGEEEKSQMGNKISAMLVDLATNFADPIERLKKIKENTQSSKTYSKAIPADKIMEFIPSEVAARAGRTYIKMGLSKMHNPFFNLVITNVPGPPIPLYLNGFMMKNLYGFGANLDWLGVMIVIFSYAGNISLSVTTDKSVIPDLKVFLRMLRSSLKELEDAAAVPA